MGCPTGYTLILYVAKKPALTKQFNNDPSK